MPSDGAPGARRLHPTSLLFNIGNYGFTLLLPGVLVLLFAVGDEEDAWVMWAFLPAVVYSVFRYLTLRYSLSETELVIHEGVLFRSTRHVPYARIQNVDTVQNPLHRLFGVVVVRIETAAGKEPEAVLQVVSTRALEELRRGIFGRDRAGELGAAEGGAEGGDVGVPGGGGAVPALAAAAPRRREPFFRMRTADVLLFGFFAQRGLAYLAAAFFLAWEFDLFERFEDRFGVDPEIWVRDLVRSLEAPPLGVWIAGAAVMLLLLQALTAAWAFVTLHGFRLERVGEDLRATCGLWTRQTATVPRRRIQRLALREGWLLRRLGRGSVRVTTAGGDSTEESQISRKWLVPVAPVGALGAVLRVVQPEVDLEAEGWQPVHPRARVRMARRWLAVLAAATAALVANFGPWALLALPAASPAAFLLAARRQRRLGWRLDGGAVYSRDGWLGLTRTAVRFTKIQSATFAQSPFDRRARMATLRVATAGPAGATGGFAVPYLPVRVARRLVRRLEREAARVEFRW